VEATAAKWELKGTVLIACNCDYGCPCNFNAPPTQGHCEGGWTWHVEQGRYDDVGLDGLTFTVMVKWPGAIHEGNGHAVILVDERADEAQREAIATLTGGEVGGPWGVLAWTWPNVDGPHAVAYEVDFDGVDSKVRAGDSLLIESQPIRNPVTGAEVHPGAVLPEGIIVKRADFGSSKTFSVDDAISFDHSGRYTAVGPFDYAGPP
jgi:hypothetical protein